MPPRGHCWSQYLGTFPLFSNYCHPFGDRVTIYIRNLRNRYSNELLRDDKILRFAVPVLATRAKCFIHRYSLCFVDVKTSKWNPKVINSLLLYPFSGTDGELYEALMFLWDQVYGNANNKENIKLHFAGPLWREPSMTSGLAWQGASNAESVSMSLCQHIAASFAWDIDRVGGY